jgi:hypothetical protein
MSVADELARLDALRRANELSEDEFQIERARLLVTPAPGTGALGAEQTARPDDHPEDSDSFSVAGTPRRFRLPVWTIVVAALVVVATVAGVLIASSGESALSPAPAAMAFSTSYGRGHQRVVCAALLPSQRSACNSALEDTAVTFKHIAIGRVQISGNRAVVVTTGSICPSSLPCVTNSDPNLGFDSGKSFQALWAIATSGSSSWVEAPFVVAAEKETGKWYVTAPYFELYAGAPPTNSTSAVEPNLEDALTAALDYHASNNDSWARLVAKIERVGTGLQWLTPSTAASASSTEISSDVLGDATLILAAEATDTKTCYVVLSTETIGPTAALSNEGPGTFYGIQTNDSDCNAAQFVVKAPASSWTQPSFPST